MIARQRKQLMFDEVDLSNTLRKITGNLRYVNVKLIYYMLAISLAELSFIVITSFIDGEVNSMNKFWIGLWGTLTVIYVIGLYLIKKHSK